MAFTRNADIRRKQLASTLTIGEVTALTLLFAYVMTRKPADTLPSLLAEMIAAREALLNNLNP
jgi:hypothetical protein